MKLKLTTLFLFAFHSALFSQSLKILDDKVLLKEALEKSTFDIDSNAKAIILYQAGSCDFDNGNYDYRYEVIIKILSDEAADDVAEIAIAKRENSYVPQIKAETFNLQDGAIIKNTLEKNNILTDKINESLKVLKFNIPNVKKGSIVHYFYKIHRSSVSDIPDWYFQNSYPTLVSSYSIKVNSAISYSKILRSSVPFKIVKSAKEMQTCEACEHSEKYESIGSNDEWIRRNIPAFEKENYSSSAENFKERIKLIITSYYVNGIDKPLFNNWNDFSKKFLYGNEDYIGQVFKSNAFLSDTVEALIKDKSNNLDKAKAIFSFVRDNYNETENGNQNIKTVFKTGKGNNDGINLLLTAMLKKANLDADPIVMSTKSNEKLSRLYTDYQNIDYTVVLLKDKNKSYYLDATNHQISFGMLKPICYNGYARVVNKDGGEVVLNPDSIKNKTNHFVLIEPSTDQKKLLLKVDKRYGSFSAFEARKEWKGDMNEAIKSFNQSFSSGFITSKMDTFFVKNINNPDLPLEVHYEMTLDINPQNTLLYINPFLSKLYNKNPFKSTKRNLPIEFDYNEDYNYVFNLKLPQGYVLDDYPKSTIVTLSDGSQMTFKNLLSYDEESNLFSLNSKFITTKTIYNAEDYEDIRQIFEKVIEEQNKQIIVKKM